MNSPVLMKRLFSFHSTGKTTLCVLFAQLTRNSHHISSRFTELRVLLQIMSAGSATKGLFSLPLELHTHISGFTPPCEIISLARTCRSAYRIYKPLHLQRLVHLTRKSIQHHGLHFIEFEELERVFGGVFHQRVVRTLAESAPVEIVKQFFDMNGWAVKKELIDDAYSDDYIPGMEAALDTGSMPPNLAMLALQVLFLIIVQTKEEIWETHANFIQEFDSLCARSYPPTLSPRFSRSTKPSYKLPPASYLSRLDLRPTSPLRNLALLIILAKNLGPDLNVYLMPYYVPWFHLHYPQIAIYLMQQGLSVHATYPPPFKGPPSKLLRYMLRVNVRMVRLLLSRGVDPNEPSFIASCSLQRAVERMGPHANPLVQMRAVDLLFSGHILPGFGDVQGFSTKNDDIMPCAEMVEKAMQMFDVLREFGAEVDMQRIEETVVAGYNQVFGIYGEDVFVDSISHSCSYIAMYLIGVGRRLGFGFFLQLPDGVVARLERIEARERERKGTWRSEKKQKNRGCWCW